MKTIGAGLLESFQSRATTLAICWRITRTDNVVMGFTNASRDLIVSGVIYVARSGFTGTAVTSASDLSVDNLELEGLIQDAGLTEEDIRAGVYDYADVMVFQVDYTDLSKGIVILRRGNIGELTQRDNIYVSEIRGMSQKLARIIIRIVLPECDAELYDNRCTVSPTNFTNDGVVTDIVDDRFRFKVALSGTPRPAGYFNGGLITFASGAGDGRSAEVDWHFPDSSLQLYLRFPWLIETYDTFSVQRGCDKSIETCKEVFNNIVNFRGFHKVPGNDAIFKVPDVKK